ncbi:MAG: hypothetical protein J7L31_01970 [Thermoplasmata archaeon]|jgi:cell division protein FtsB|nr:hypothetical protein [Thermoplasmata archaeon]
MLDNITVTILVLLSFLLVWIGIMIFTTKPEEEEEEEQVEMVAEKTPEKEDVKEMESNEIEKYRFIIAELEEKLRRMEERAPASEKLFDWLTELRRENEFLKMKIAHLEGGGFSGEALKYENEKLRRELEEYKAKVEALEREVKELKNSINYYRDLVSKLQGSYTVLNKHNYRICIRNPETGEYEYQLVKLPPDFDPFNPTYITRDGMEVYEEYGIRIPTKLGDIIREEFKKDLYWQDFELDK